MDPYGTRYPWYQTQRNPHVYVPPPFNDPYYQQSSGWHFFDRAQPKLLHLHPALAAETTNIRYDLRKSPRDGMLVSTSQVISVQPAFAQPTTDVRIVSKAFPWTIDIRAPAGSVVTCSTIFESLYAMLQEPIMDSEWGIVIHEKSRKESIEKAAKVRSEKDKDTRLKRIDWLGESTAFKGLERDEEFEKRRLLPGSQSCKETWLVKFGKS